MCVSCKHAFSVFISLGSESYRWIENSLIRMEKDDQESALGPNKRILSASPAVYIQTSAKNILLDWVNKEVRNISLTNKDSQQRDLLVSVIFSQWQAYSTLSYLTVLMIFCPRVSQSSRSTRAATLQKLIDNSTCTWYSQSFTRRNTDQITQTYDYHTPWLPITNIGYSLTGLDPLSSAWL